MAPIPDCSPIRPLKLSLALPFDQTIVVLRLGAIDFLKLPQPSRGAIGISYQQDSLNIQEFLPVKIQTSKIREVE